MTNTISFLLFLIITILPYCDTPVYQSLQQKLGQTYAGGQDPYAKEYENIHPLLRYTELREKKENLYMVDNFRMGVHMDGEEEYATWSSALIDTAKVKSATFALGVFDINLGIYNYKAGHAFLIFQFEDGGVLTPRGQVEGIVSSYEAYRENGVKYSFLKGLRDAYENVVVVGSNEDVFTKSATTYSRLFLYPLDLSQSELKAVLEKSLDDATNREFLNSEKYHTTRNSCITNQVRILNHVLPDERDIPEWNTLFGIKIMRSLASIVPRRIGKTLIRLGIASHEIELEGKEEVLEFYDIFKQGIIPEPSSRKAIFEKLYNES